MAKRLLFAGYIGCGNLGDDAMLLGIVRALRDDRYDLAVMSGDPFTVHELYGLSAFFRRDMKRVKEEIARCDALVFPGGSIFQDVTSVRSVAFYARLVQLAKKNKKKVVLLGQGIGPLNNFLAKKMALEALRSADALAVRDQQSASALKSLGFKRAVPVTADTAFLMPPPNKTQEGYQLAGMKTVGLAPRPWKKGVDIVGLFADLSKRISAMGYIPFFIGMDRQEDVPLIQQIAKVSGGHVPDLKQLRSPSDIQARLQRMEAVIAMRLHAGVLAATVGIPPLMIAYDPKVTAFSKSLGISEAAPLEGQTGARLAEQVQAFLKNRDKHAEAVVRRRDELIKLAHQNVELLRQTVGPA